MVKMEEVMMMIMMITQRRAMHIQMILKKISIEVLWMSNTNKIC